MPDTMDETIIETPTAKLRWYNGVLQQWWDLTTQETMLRASVSAGGEWRDVPTETG